jgi:hypothetical protein
LGVVTVLGTYGAEIDLLTFPIGVYKDIKERKGSKRKGKRGKRIEEREGMCVT